jgi:arylsulfatase A-like enzyme
MLPALLATLFQATLQGSSRPDVVILLADDVAQADVEELETPNLDLLAAQGMRFERAYSNPLCAPTRRALTFGRWWTNAGGNFCRPPDTDTPGARPSLPQLARAAGYRSALFGKWHVGSNPLGPFELAPQFHGYERWRAGIPSNVIDLDCGRGTYFEWPRVDDGRSSLFQGYTDTAIRDEFLAWWEATAGPRFAVLAFQLAHQPFHAPPAELLPPGTPPATGARAQYRQMVRALDTLVGQVLSVLGPEDVVFFLSDNGTPNLVAPGGGRAKGTTFERGIHVPLIVRAPFVRAGTASTSLVHVVDLYATLGDILGQRRRHPDSVSFLPILVAPAARTRSFVFCGQSNLLQGGPIPGGGDDLEDRCVRSERYKLRVLDHGRQEFYDLWSDPEEFVPLALDDPAVAGELAWHRNVFARLVTGP